MKNVRELRDNLGQVFEGLRAESVKPQVAKELANVAGKMINSVKLELLYADARKATPKIPFLD